MNKNNFHPLDKRLAQYGVSARSKSGATGNHSLRHERSVRGMELCHPHDSSNTRFRHLQVQERVMRFFRRHFHSRRLLILTQSANRYWSMLLPLTAMPGPIVKLFQLQARQHPLLFEVKTIRDVRC